MNSLSERARRAQWRGEHRCPERRRLLLARGFALHRDEPAPTLRRAKVLGYVLDHYPVVIDDGDRLVGKFLSAPLSEAETDELRAAGPLLAGLQQGLRFGPGSGGVGGHRTIDFETLLAKGVRGLLDEVERRAAGDVDPDQASFYLACRIVLEALLRFVDRYRQRLAEGGQTELAKMLERVPAEPLSENIGPAPGAERAGAVSKALSIAKLDHRYGLGGLSVNYRFGRELFRTSEDRQKVAAFIRAALGQGLFQIQLNVVDTATLRAAQAEPEAYPSLRVRVAGYSEYFARLPRQQQDEVIARAEQAV